MIELQFLNKIISDKSMEPLFLNGIDSSHFIAYKNEYEFIAGHYSTYNNAPVS